MGAIVKVNSWVSDKAYCLDLCGGTGMLAKSLHSRGIGGKWFNLDHSAPMLTQTPEGVERILSGAESIPLSSKSMDLVIIRSAFDYIDTSKVLPEVARVLNSEGRLVVAQKTLDAYSACPSWLMRMQQYRNHRKSAPVSGADLEKVLKADNFHVLDHKKIITKQNYALEDWVSRSGSISREDQSKILNFLDSTPRFLMDDLGLEISNSHIAYRTSWSVILCKFSNDELADCRVVATAIPFRATPDGYEVFLHRRFTEPEYWGVWELPQGHVASGESFFDGAVRELLEETGLLSLAVPKEPKSNTQSGVFFARKGSRNFFAVPVPILVDGEPNYGNNEREYCWVKLSEMGKFISEEDVYPPNRLMLEEISEAALSYVQNERETSR